MKLLLLTLLLTLATPALAADLFVKTANASLLSKKSALSERLAPLTRGQKLDVIGKEGTWLKVRVEGKEGYVHENSVSTSGGGGSGMGSAFAETGSGSGSATETLAGRGGFESDNWAKGAGKSKAGLDRMLALREQVKDADITAFSTAAPR